MPASTMPVPTVSRDMQAEEQEGDEIEEGRPEHRILRPQHPGRDDGGDGVGGVVQAIEEIESSATPISAISSGRREDTASIDVSRLPSDVLDDDAADLVGDVLEAVDHFLQMVVDLGADDEGHGVGLARAA